MKIKGIILLACTMVLASCTKTDNIIAHVGKTPITQQEFDAYLHLKKLRNLSPQDKAKHLQIFAERKALVQAIEASNKVDIRQIDAEISDVKRNLVVSHYLDSYLTQQVSDQAVRNYYAQNQQEFATRKAKVSHILIRTNSQISEEERSQKLKLIQEAHAKAKNGADFAALVNEYSEDRVSAKKGGSLGWISDQAIAPNFAHQAFTVLQEGEVSDPFITSFGYHIIKLDAAPSVVQKPFEQVRGDIRRKLRQMAKEAELSRLKQSVDVKLTENS
ncbi:peptidylprolyl isomerase [Catenovulum sediminis]|uniref:peptidylprolyl isomerase n=1 Tax=Catenovulum sediminis TaxID=1740262 RepID=A0ABV1REH7_9ALTE|nr:peptidylprolyl isomerase [Catenovulum sediminis]